MNLSIPCYPRHLYFIISCCFKVLTVFALAFWDLLHGNDLSFFNNNKSSSLKLISRVFTPYPSLNEATSLHLFYFLLNSNNIRVMLQVHFHAFSSQSVNTLLHRVSFFFRREILILVFRTTANIIIVIFITIIILTV